MPTTLQNKHYQRYKTKDLVIELNVHGSRTYKKISFPVKYGRFSRITTPQAILEFNLNHEIRHAQSRQKTWIHPQEWLKRTVGNDWVYYSTGGYSGVFEALGEYYLPNLTYPTNSLLGGKPFDEPGITGILSQWHTMIKDIPQDGMPSPFAEFLENTLKQTPKKLDKKACHLFSILGTRVSVMPPDARHVDYNIIPLPICDGCLYKCRFCKVKNKTKYTTHSKETIRKTICELKVIYGNDLSNYNALFLGDHDALNAASELILYAASKAFEVFNFSASFMKNSFLFLFGSVDSLLNKRDDFFESLNQLPYITYINIGLESHDAATLKKLGKPVTAGDVAHAFKKIQAINQKFQNIEVTCNFVMDESLPTAHYDALFDLIRKSVERPCPKGTVYLSPLAFGQPSRQVLYDFYRLKAKARFPTFLYVIQRL